MKGSEATTMGVSSQQSLLPLSVRMAKLRTIVEEKPKKRMGEN
ncbi:uncharacterized protein G2W53_010530 [Senna tora]|uniref:Uncharacterized protein n=1 Tax=Senna tora TaxID=362788 RepID=A0A834X026_9FABA|nr:uncharacterized protein G2W53_010530 [Senna tora]